MKTKLFAISCMAATIAFGSDAQAAPYTPPSGTASATSAVAGAKIKQSIVVTKVRDLYFGEVIANSSADNSGTVTVAANDGGARSCTGGISELPGTATPTSAKFEVGGEGAVPYAITLPSASATITRVGGSETMTVNLALEKTSGTIPLGPSKDTFCVGGTMNAASHQQSGEYTGSFDVNVAYN
ncbi:MAG: DUF4402 domain-containing protein [Chlorobiaceae bacterium]